MARRRNARVKKLVLELAEALGGNAKVYREWNVPKSTFYEWKKAFREHGMAGLRRKKPVGRRWPTQLSPDAAEKILHLRTEYRLGPQRKVCLR